MKSKDEQYQRRQMQKGRKTKVNFYAVGSGEKTSIEYGDQEPLGRLLDLYCKRQKLTRKDVKFDVWEEEVFDGNTWSKLAKKHELSRNDAIDMVSR